MQTSANGIAFIKKNEGLVLKAGDDVGHQAIGYGHDLLPGESYPDGITQDQADAILAQDVSKVDAAMNAQHLSIELNQNQWDALADFCFNCGKGALIQLLAHGIDQVPMQLMRWTHAGGEENAGLKARRESEVELWNAASQ